jgi:hypothetical protein
MGSLTINIAKPGISKNKIGFNINIPVGKYTLFLTAKKKEMLMFIHTENGYKQITGNQLEKLIAQFWNNTEEEA